MSEISDLLGSSWQAGGRAAALNDEKDARNLGVIGKADGLIHQRDTGS